MTDASVRYLFDGFPNFQPRTEGRSVDCPHCGCRCADRYCPDFTTEQGCEALIANPPKETTP